MGAIHVKANNASDYFRIEDYNELESMWKNVWPNFFFLMKLFLGHLIQIIFL